MTVASDGSIDVRDRRLDRQAVAFGAARLSGDASTRPVAGGGRGRTGLACDSPTWTTIIPWAGCSPSKGGTWVRATASRTTRSRSVNRRIGKQNMTITVLDNDKNAEGRFLPHSYVVHHWDAATGKLNRVETFQERWRKVGSWDLPVSRSILTASDGRLSVKNGRLLETCLTRTEMTLATSGPAAAGGRVGRGRRGCRIIPDQLAGAEQVADVLRASDRAECSTRWPTRGSSWLRRSAQIGVRAPAKHVVVRLILARLGQELERLAVNISSA